MPNLSLYNKLNSRQVENDFGARGKGKKSALIMSSLYISKVIALTKESSHNLRGPTYLATVHLMIYPLLLSTSVKMMVD